METEILCDLCETLPQQPEKTLEQRPRKVYPSDVSDEEWVFVRPYLTLMSLDAEQRKYDLRDVFDAMRWIVRTGSPWRFLPGDFPRWRAVYDQTQRWIAAGCFEDILDDAREIARVAQGKEAQPTAVIIDSQTLRSTVESGARAGYDGAKLTRGSKVHIAVDTLGTCWV